MNGLKTVALMVALTALLVLVGDLLGGRIGLILGLTLAVAANGVAYWWSDRLAVRLTGARPLDASEAPVVHRLLRELSADAGLPVPRAYWIPSDQPNAFAAGRDPNNAIVAVTRGLLNELDERQLRGVLAHELAHINNRDILLSTLAAVLAGALTAAARLGWWQLVMGGRSRRHGSYLVGLLGILAIVFAPIAALLIRLAISREREFEADRVGARIAGDPSGLASALERMGQLAGRRPLPVNEATAHMFIVNPLRGDFLSRLFATHPPLTLRIARLEDLR